MVPKNVLVTTYCRDEWERSFASTKDSPNSLIIGLGVGMFMFASTLIFSFCNLQLYLQRVSVVSFVLAIALIADPLMIFERRLVGIERKLDFSNRGFEGSYKLMDGLNGWSLKKESSWSRLRHSVVFMATSIFFTPLPVYLKEFSEDKTNMSTSLTSQLRRGNDRYFLSGDKPDPWTLRNRCHVYPHPKLASFRPCWSGSLAIAPTVLTCVI